MVILETDTPEQISAKILEALKTELYARGIDYERINGAPMFGLVLKQLLNKELPLDRFFNICGKLSIFNHGL